MKCHRSAARKRLNAFFSDFPCAASACSVFGIAAGSHLSRCARRNLLRPHRSELAAGSPPSLRDGGLLRPHRAPYCLLCVIQLFCTVAGNIPLRNVAQQRSFSAATLNRVWATQVKSASAREIERGWQLCLRACYIPPLSRPKHRHGGDQRSRRRMTQAFKEQL